MPVCSLVLSLIAPHLRSSGSPGIRNSDSQGGLGCLTRVNFKKKKLTGQANACPNHLSPGDSRLGQVDKSHSPHLGSYQMVLFFSIFRFQFNILWFVVCLSDKIQITIPVALIKLPSRKEKLISLLV